MDGVAATADMAAILDGATVRTDTGCIHGVPWFVENLAGSLVKHQETSPADALTGAITETAAAHGNTCDLDHPGTPSAALAIAQVHGDALRYLVLGDVTLAIEITNGVRIIADNRVDSTATAERAAADALPAGSPQKAEALVRMKHAELAARNVPGGFWIAAADPAAVSHSLTGEIPLHVIRRVVLLTDGAARAVSPFKIYDWPGIFSVVTDEGPRSLIKQVRIAEDADHARCHPALSDDGRLSLSGCRPAVPSMNSRTISAWPACRFVSAITCASILSNVTSPWLPHHGTWPTASSVRAPMVSSACAHARW